MADSILTEAEKEAIYDAERSGTIYARSAIEEIQDAGPLAPLRQAAREMDQLGISAADFGASLPPGPLSDAEMLTHMQRFTAGYKAGQAIAAMQTERHTHYSDTREPITDPWTTYTLGDASIDVHDSGTIPNICIGKEMLEIADNQQVRDLMTLLTLANIERPPLRRTRTPTPPDGDDDSNVWINHRVDDEGSPSVEYTARTVELVQDFSNPPSFGPFTLYIRNDAISFDGPITLDLLGEIMLDMSFLVSNAEVRAAFGRRPVLEEWKERHAAKEVA